MRIGVLALQGAFAEHIIKLGALGVDAFEIRSLRDLNERFDALVLPGGESTAMRKLLVDLGLYAPLKKLIQDGLPVLGTCAGMILLAKEIAGGEPPCFGTLDVTVRRNAYGRQLGSFRGRDRFADYEIETPFIRAPYIEKIGESATELSRRDGKITAVRQDAQLAVAFHPELTDDPAVYRYFFDMIAERK